MKSIQKNIIDIIHDITAAYVGLAAFFMALFDGDFFNVEDLKEDTAARTPFNCISEDSRRGRIARRDDGDSGEVVLDIASSVSNNREGDDDDDKTSSKTMIEGLGGAGFTSEGDGGARVGTEEDVDVHEATAGEGGVKRRLCCISS